jgi:hypothetical protein
MRVGFSSSIPRTKLLALLCSEKFIETHMASESLRNSSIHRYQFVPTARSLRFVSAASPSRRNGCVPQSSRSLSQTLDSYNFFILFFM